MAIHEQIISIKNREYKIELNEFFLDKTLCWNAYRKIGGGGVWEKIPCLSRGECKRFPKPVGLAANKILEDYKRHTGKN